MLGQSQFIQVDFSMAWFRPTRTSGWFLCTSEATSSIPRKSVSTLRLSSFCSALTFTIGNMLNDVSVLKLLRNSTYESPCAVWCGVDSDELEGTLCGGDSHSIDLAGPRAVQEDSVLLKDDELQHPQEGQPLILPEVTVANDSPKTAVRSHTTVCLSHRTSASSDNFSNFSTNTVDSHSL